MTSQFFDYRDADIVLRSCAPDTVDFRVHKHVLAIASTFFESMFTLPQGEGWKGEGCGSGDDELCLPIVDVSEDAPTLETLLRIIYPLPDPTIDSLDHLIAVLAAACKYDIDVAIQHLRVALLAPAFLHTNPLRVYAIACRFELDAEARLASRHTLRVNVAECPLTDDLRHISAFQYHRLLDLHRRRAKAAQELIVYNNEFKCMMCNGTHYGAFVPPQWWKDWEGRAKEELRARPDTSVIFSLPFLAESARMGCERCAGSVLNANQFLEKLKREMDALPTTVD